MKNNYEIVDGVAMIQVWDYKSQSTLICMVDEADLPAVDISGTWTASKAASQADKWYVVAKMRSRTVLMHRVVLGVRDRSLDVHHKDNDGLNNRRGNLEPCSHQENVRLRYPGTDWAGKEARETASEEYRKERKIASDVAEWFGLTRQALHAIRTGKTATSPAAKFYSLTVKEAGVRPLWEMKQGTPAGVKFGIA